MADLAPFNFIAPPTGRGDSLRPRRRACKVGGKWKRLLRAKVVRHAAGTRGEVKPSKLNTNKYYKIATAGFARSFLPGTVHELTAHPLVGRINGLVIHCCSFLLHQGISSASSQGPSAALCKVFHFALVSYFIHVIFNEWERVVDFLRRRSRATASLPAAKTSCISIRSVLQHLLIKLSSIFAPHSLHRNRPESSLWLPSGDKTLWGQGPVITMNFKLKSYHYHFHYFPYKGV